VCGGLLLRPLYSIMARWLDVGKYYPPSYIGIAGLSLSSRRLDLEDDHFTLLIRIITTIPRLLYDLMVW
jgi:hypothetical protein